MAKVRKPVRSVPVECSEQCAFTWQQRTVSLTCSRRLGHTGKHIGPVFPAITVMGVRRSRRQLGVVGVVGVTARCEFTWPRDFDDEDERVEL